MAEEWNEAGEVMAILIAGTFVFPPTASPIFLYLRGAACERVLAQGRAPTLAVGERRAHLTCLRIKSPRSSIFACGTCGGRAEGRNLSIDHRWAVEDTNGMQTDARGVQYGRQAKPQVEQRCSERMSCLNSDSLAKGPGGFSQ
jgi:hypothetical protein